MKVTIEDIKKAQATISAIIRETPIRHSEQLSEMCGFDLHLKMENTQRTGSFKIRGAANKILSLSAEERARGVIAASAGNHAQGVACVAQLEKIRAVIVMPEKSPLIKVTSTRRFGAEVILKGQNYDEAFEHSQEIMRQEGLIYVHPYQDEKIIAGQGTIGLEIYESMPDLDAVFVAIGGGGLVSGIASALKVLNPKIKIIGVQAEGARSMADSFQRKELVLETSHVSTIADGIAVKRPSEIMYRDFISKLCDEVVTVSDEDIAQAIVLLIERCKSISEGAGAASLAACLSRKNQSGIKKALAVVGGGNIDLNIIERVIDRGLQVSGRVVRISVGCPDKPGVMYKLTQVIAEVGANILEINHNRVDSRILLRETLIEFTLETTGHEQVQVLRQGIQKLGFRIL